MSRARIKFMTNRVYQKILNRIGYVNCHLCKQDMPINFNYISLKSAKNSRAKQYHLECAEKVNLTCV